LNLPRARQSGQFLADFLILPDCAAAIACYIAAFRLPALVRRSEPQENDMPDEHKSESGFQYSLSNLKPAQPVEKVTLTFPDGAKREFPRNTTGLDIAQGISPSLAKRTVAMALDGVLYDLKDPITEDAKIELISRDDARAGTDPA
jgi:hypothetical protein